MIRLFIVFGLFFAASSQADDAQSTLPSVARRAIVCDLWQLNANAATWGCLKQPREVSVAQGGATDQVIAALQEQIRLLEERVKKLEK